MSVRQVADLTGKHPVDAMLDITVADELRTLFFAAPPQGNSNLLKEIVQYPHMLFGVSDGGAHTKFLTAGRYPTETLAQQVRDNQWLTYEEAHRRLSGLPAQLAGFQDRGLLRNGGPADVVVYDPEALAVGENHVVEDLPGGEWRRIQRATGYHAVVVNGERTITDDGADRNLLRPPSSPRPRLSRPQETAAAEARPRFGPGKRPEGASSGLGRSGSGRTRPARRPGDAGPGPRACPDRR